MSLAADQCICISRTEYSETSQVLGLFSREHGLLRVIAKGAHRRTKAGASKFDGGIDLLDRGEAIFTDDASRELAILTEWRLTDGHLSLRNSLRATYLAMYAAELTGRFSEERDAHPRLFDQLATVLDQLPTRQCEEASLNFQLGLLREAGYTPEFFACTSCRRDVPDSQPIWFSPASGGIVCRNCEASTPDRMELDTRLWRLVQGLLRSGAGGAAGARLPQLTRRQTDPLNRLLADHMEQILGRRLLLRPYILPNSTHVPADHSQPELIRSR